MQTVVKTSPRPGHESLEAASAAASIQRAQDPRDSGVALGALSASLIPIDQAQKIITSIREAFYRKANDGGTLDRRELDVSPIESCAARLIQNPAHHSALLGFHDHVYLPAKIEMGEYLDDRTIDRRKLQALASSGALNAEKSEVQAYLEGSSLSGRIRKGDVTDTAAFIRELQIPESNGQSLIAVPDETVVLSRLYRPSAAFLPPEQSELIKLQAFGMVSVLSILQVAASDPSGLSRDEAPALVHAAYTLERPTALGAQFSPSHEYALRQRQFDELVLNCARSHFSK